MITLQITEGGGTVAETSAATAASGVVVTVRKTVVPLPANANAGP